MSFTVVNKKSNKYGYAGIPVVCWLNNVEYRPRSSIVVSCSSSIFGCLWNLQANFHMGSFSFLFHQQTIRIPVLEFWLLWRNPMAIITLIKESIELELALSSVVYHHGGKHGDMHAAMMLGQWLRVLHLEKQDAREKSEPLGLAWVSDTSKPKPVWSTFSKKTIPTPTRPHALIATLLMDPLWEPFSFKTP